MSLKVTIQVQELERDYLFMKARVDLVTSWLLANIHENNPCSAGHVARRGLIKLGIYEDEDGDPLCV